MHTKKKILSGAELQNTLSDLIQDDVFLAYYDEHISNDPFNNYFSCNFEGSFAGCSLPSDAQLRKSIVNHPEFKKKIDVLIGEIVEQIGRAFSEAETDWEDEKEQEEERLVKEKLIADQLKKKAKLLKTFSSDQIAALKEIGVSL